MDQYDIRLEDKRIGTAFLEKQGLYCRIQCNCRMQEEAMYRVHILCDSGRIDLGTCVKAESDYTIDTKIPLSRLKGKPEFVLCIPGADREIFCPITPDAPFAYLEYLPGSVLTVRDGKAGIVIQE